MIDEEKLVQFLETRHSGALSILWDNSVKDPENLYTLGKLVVYSLIREKIRAGEFE